MVRKPKTSEGRDPERTPMQWDDSPNAGFSPPGVETWLPVNPDYPAVNVARQEQNPDSTLNFYRRLLVLRKTDPVLLYGDFAFVEHKSENVLVFSRMSELGRYLVAINFSGEPQSLELSAELQDCKVIISTLSGSDELHPGCLNLRPHEGLLLQG